MATKRNKGWPKTLKMIVLDSLSEGIDSGFDEGYQPFEWLPKVVEEYRKTTLLLAEIPCLTFTYRGPDKERDYALIVKDGSNQKLLELFINLISEHSRMAAVEGVSEMINQRIRSIVKGSNQISLFQEFSNREMKMEKLE